MTPLIKIEFDPTIEPEPFTNPINSEVLEKIDADNLVADPDSKSFNTPVITSSTFFDKSLFSYP